jgi:hypothetical protein
LEVMMERMSVNPTAPAARSGSDRDSSTRRPKAFFLGAALFLASLLVLSACATRAEPRADVTSGSSPAARENISIPNWAMLLPNNAVLEQLNRSMLNEITRF